MAKLTHFFHRLWFKPKEYLGFNFHAESIHCIGNFFILPLSLNEIADCLGFTNEDSEKSFNDFVERIEATIADDISEIEKSTSFYRLIQYVLEQQKKISPHLHLSMKTVCNMYCDAVRNFIDEFVALQ